MSGGHSRMQHNDKPGRFEIASGGTSIFWMRSVTSLCHLQAKLLSVLAKPKGHQGGFEQGRFPVDVRLICATNMPLYEMTLAKRIQRRLCLYRINTVEIRIPPL